MTAVILASDEAFAAFIRESTGMALAPVVRASTYRTLDGRQDQWANLFGRDDPRRPVVMRGAKLLLQYKDRTKSDYGRSVVERFLRRVRFTSFERDHAHRFIDTVHENVSYYISRRHQFCDDRHRIGIFYGDTCRIWLFGKCITVTKHQYSYLRRLHGLIDKTTKLEKNITAFQEAA